jgi:UDP-2,3-diacylglucosamine pyrophosphatase LpxH
LSKLKAAVAQFVDEKVDFVISLGDIIDGSSEIPRPPKTRAHLVEALEAFSPLKSQGINVYNTLGNHCLYVSESKAGVMRLLDWKTDHAYAVVEKRNGCRFIILDGTAISLFATEPGSIANETAKSWLREHPKEKFAYAQDWNGAIDELQLLWLDVQLTEADSVGEKCFLFCHYPLVEESGGPRHLLWNHPAILKVLERHSASVAAYFSGHYHQGGFGSVNNVVHWTLPATLEAPSTVIRSGFVLEIFNEKWRIVAQEPWPNMALTGEGVGCHPFGSLFSLT